MTHEEKTPASQPRKRNLPGTRVLADIAVAFGLAILVSFIWTANSGLLVRAHWDIPVDYAGDCHQILGWIKAASEGDYHLLETISVSRLGAPVGANWNDYPMYEKAFTILLGLIARSIGLMAAANLGMMLTHATAAASFYLACRWFRWSRLWSVVGAVLFGFLYYNTMRSLAHLLLGLTYTVPWAVLASWLIATRRKLPRYSRAWKFCVAVSFLMGVSNPYYLNMYVQFLLLSLLIVWFRDRRRDNLETGVICLFTSAAGFLLAHTGMLMFRLFAGANPYAVARTYREAEIYALRPIELFIPPKGHRLDWFSEIGSRYKSETNNIGELFAPYLGVLAGLGLVLLVFWSLRWLLHNQPQRVPLPFWQALWVLAYSVIGGVNCWLAYCGIGVFRAGNRYSLFIAAVLLLWLVPRLQRWTQGWSSVRAISLAALLLVLGVADQLPDAGRAAKRDQIQFWVNDDRAFSEALESRLVPGSMVFQLPLAVFPEGDPVMTMDSYEHLRPYFFTKTLRFTYGSNKGRNDSSWQAAVDRLPAGPMIKRMESYGIGALFINRRGFTDDARSLLSVLDRMGYRDRIENKNGDLVAVLLNPSAEPESPKGDLHPVNSYGHFWRRIDSNENEVLWLSDIHADLQINHQAIRTRRARLRAWISVPSVRTVSFKAAQRTLHQQKLEKDVIHLVEFEMDVPKKGQILRIETDRPTAGFQNSAALTATFALFKFEMIPIPDGE